MSSGFDFVPNPQEFEWKGRVRKTIEVLESWRAIGEWWNGEGEFTYFRVRADNEAIYEIRFDHFKGAWHAVSAVD